MRQTDSEGKYVTLSVRLSEQTADGLKRIADREYRSVAAELRRVLEAHVASAGEDLEKAA